MPVSSDTRGRVGYLSESYVRAGNGTDSLGERAEAPGHSTLNNVAPVELAQALDGRNLECLDSPGIIVRMACLAKRVYSDRRPEWYCHGLRSSQESMLLKMTLYPETLLDRRRRPGL